MLVKTATIRPFTRDDVPAVADLWQKVFRHSSRPASPSLRAYFEQVFCENPWQDPSLPSLVYESQRDDQVIGFLGVLPRRMTFNGQPIRVAVATQLMVDATKRRGFTAIELMRRFFAGPQDLSFSDGANETARQVWERAGGTVSPLYSLEWTRALRPAAFLLSRLARSASGAGHERRAPLAAICRWAASPLDCLAGRLSLAGGSCPLPEGLSIEPATPEALYSCVAARAARYALAPDYDPASWRWLLTRAAQARAFGTLLGRVVRDANDQIGGWFIYYARPDHIAQVLQVGAGTLPADCVLSCLFHDACRQGAIALSAQADPLTLDVLSANRCRLTCPGFGVLVQSRSSELLNAIHRGHAMLTRLEGEWWLRLGIDRRSDW